MVGQNLSTDTYTIYTFSVGDSNTTPALLSNISADSASFAGPSTAAPNVALGAGLDTKLGQYKWSEIATILS